MARVEANRLPNCWAKLVGKLEAERVADRVWRGDPSLWQGDSKEIASRLGWLRSHETACELLPELRGFVSELRADGLTRAIVLGMGGASLVAETLAAAFPPRPGFPSVDVLDSTHPEAVRGIAGSVDPSRTLFVVSSKSGTTLETLTLFQFFHAHLARALGDRQAGAHFVAVTDPKTPLAAFAEQYGFRKNFLNDPTVGGRYAALSYVGLLPACLLGADADELLGRAGEAAGLCRSAVGADVNPALKLGALLAGFALEGRDKLTLVASPAVDGFGPWLEQLVAESTGKDGRGILPIIGESLGRPSSYGDDRLFVEIVCQGERSQASSLDALSAAGHPVVYVDMSDAYDLGGQFLLWELATAVAAHILGVNPFTQPDVELSKQRTREAMARKQVGLLGGSRLPFLTSEALFEQLRGVRPPAYLAFHAYLAPDPVTSEALCQLAEAVRDRTCLAVTVGYGPRFLHSTGQLHKGDAGRGLFVQLVGEDVVDVPIPSQLGTAAASTFGALLRAQADGDAQALAEKARVVSSYSLGAEPPDAVRRVAAQLASRSS